jgi:hypothetical protein
MNRRNVLQCIKVVYTIVSEGKVQSFSLKSGTRHECSLYPLLPNILLEFLARKIQQLKERRDSIGKKEFKLF